MAAGIALLGMLIQFAINKDHYDEEEDEEEPYEDTDKRIRKKNASNSQEYDSKYNREDLYKNPSDRRSESRIRNTDSEISSEQIDGLFLNLQFKNGSLLCTTGTSLRTFSMDKRPEQLWDDMVLNFLTQNQIIFEKL